MLSRKPLCVVLFATLLLAGCKDREITTYRAPKDPPPVMPGAAPGAPAG